MIITAIAIESGNGELGLLVAVFLWSKFSINSFQFYTLGECLQHLLRGRRTGEGKVKTLTTIVDLEGCYFILM